MRSFTHHLFLNTDDSVHYFLHVPLQYATISKLWEHAAKTVRSLKRASDGVEWADAGGCYNSRNSGVDRDRDRGGSSRPGVGQGLTPGLEAENASLKTAIFDELQEYEDSINAMKET